MSREDFAQRLNRILAGNVASRRRIVYRGRDGREIEVYEEIEVEGIRPDGVDLEDAIIRKGQWECGHPVRYADGLDNSGGQCEECGRIVCGQCYARCGDGAEPGQGCRKGLCERCLVETDTGEIFCEACAEQAALLDIARRFLPGVWRLLK